MRFFGWLPRTSFHSSYSARLATSAPSAPRQALVECTLFYEIQPDRLSRSCISFGHWSFGWHLTWSQRSYWAARKPLLVPSLHTLYIYMDCEQWQNSWCAFFLVSRWGTPPRLLSFDEEERIWCFESILSADRNGKTEMLPSIYMQLT